MILQCSTFCVSTSGADWQLHVVCAEGNEYALSIKGLVFDLIFADTWTVKYRLVKETLALLQPSGIYVVDDMVPRSDWPEGHGVKAATLIVVV